ncbi:MAG TPA: AAA family ATPase [Thermoanaerobaculia bacterium]|nr:AAA family ATPase [Thermoanaerobaculia bacterium]
MADALQQPDRLRLERRILERRGRREGREVRFLCPAHDDRQPSARWNPGKSTWFCDVCHQGGGWRDLAQRLGEPAPAPAREIAAIYPYRDAAGRLLYEVLRFVPKAFACRRPDPAGWRWNLQGVERVLYRLPELLAAVARNTEIFLTEGEKDADALAALGLEATTHAGGAGKWRPEYTRALRGARVVLLPDNDDAGRRHMQEVERSLRPLAAQVARLELPGLPDKGDVSDWLAARRAEGLGDDAIRTRLLELARTVLATSGVTARDPRSESPWVSRAATDPAGNALDTPSPLALAARRLPDPAPPPLPAGAADAEDAGLDSPPPPRLAPGVALDPAAQPPAAAGAPLHFPIPSPAYVAGAAATHKPATPRVRRLSDVTARPVHFLWAPYLPLGKLTLLDGDPGQGKSWLTAAIATAGSLGWGLPGTLPFDPFTTLFFTEDPAEDVLRPRLDLLGADCQRIWTHDSFEFPIDLSQPADVARLDELVPAYDARLIVIDPIQAFLGAKTDIYRPNEVRAVLAPLLRLAQRHACALLILRHITKARASRSIYAGQGSIDFIAAARSVLLAGSGPDDPTRHALVHIKSNLAAAGPTLGYRFDGQSFVWEGPSGLTANDLLAAEAQTDDAGAEQEARLFLRDILADSETLPARAVLAAAREAGVAERTLKRAKRREGVRTIRQGFGTGSVWLWSLPAPAAEPSTEPGHPEAWPPSPTAGPLRPEPTPEEPPADPPSPDEKVIV